MRQQARGDGVLGQRHRRESCTEYLERERDIEESRAGTADVFRERDAGRARGGELLPELGGVPQWLVRAHDFARAEAFRDRREEVDQRGLFVAQLEIHDDVYNIPECSSGRAWRRTRSRVGRRRLPTPLRSSTSTVAHSRTPNSTTRVARGPRRSNGSVCAPATTWRRCCPTRSIRTEHLLALGWLRAVEVPLNTAYVGRMLAYTVDHSDATTLVTTKEYLDRVTEIRADVPGLQQVVVLDARRLRRREQRRRWRHRVAGARVSRHPLAHVHVGHDGALEGGDHAVGGDVPVLVVGTR